MDDGRFDDLKTVIERGFDQINARLDRQNGRIGATEVAIGVLQDRSDRIERQSDQATARNGTISAIVGAVAGALAGVFKS